MPPSVVVIADDPEEDVTMDSGAPCGIVDTAYPFAGLAGAPPGLDPPVAPAGAALGSIFDKVAREYIESEILVSYDSMLVDNATKISCDGSTVWCKATETFSLLGFDFWI